MCGVGRLLARPRIGVQFTCAGASFRGGTLLAKPSPSLAPESGSVGNPRACLRGNRRPSVVPTALLRGNRRPSVPTLPPFRRRAPSGLPTLPVSRAAHRPDYRRSRFLAHSGRRITDAPPFPRFFAPAAGKKPTHYRRSPFSAQTSQRQPQALDLALLSNLPRHRQSAASIPTAFRKRKLTFSCFSIDSWLGLPKVGPWIS